MGKDVDSGIGESVLMTRDIKESGQVEKPERHLSSGEVL